MSRTECSRPSETVTTSPISPSPVGDRAGHPRQLAGAVRDLDPVGAVEHGLPPPSERGSLRGCIYHAMPPGPPSPDPVPSLRRLLPEPGSRSTSASCCADWTWAARAPADRPYTIVNFVASADGHAAFGGRSRWLSDDADRRDVPRPARAGRRGDGRHRHAARRALRADGARSRAPAAARCGGPEPGAAGRDHQPQRRRPHRHPAVRGARVARRGVHARRRSTPPRSRPRWTWFGSIPGSSR